MEGSDVITAALGKEPLCQHCASLVLLCGKLDYFPINDAPKIRALVAALHRASEDHGHSDRTIRTWVENNAAAPKVSDICRTAAAERTPSVLPDGCKECAGAPFVVRNGTAQRCSCARGKALVQMAQGGK